MARGSHTFDEPILGAWLLPIRGVVRGINDLAISKDTLLDGSNIEIIDSTLRGRRGLTTLSSTLFGARPMAGLNIWQNNTASFIVLATTAKIWTYDISGAAWTDRSGSLTATADDATRIIQFAFGTPTVTRAYVCNGVNVLKTWKAGDASASNVSGTPPIFRDLTVLGNYILGLVGSHDIRWSNPLTDATWPAGNIKVIAETPSPTAAIRHLGNLGAVCYKKDGAWLGELTGLAGASAIRWTFLVSLEGPAGPPALVEAGDGGPHVYMTRTGRIGMFDGAAIRWIAEGVWSIIKDEIDQTKPNRIWGVYKQADHQVWFTYKRTGQTNTDGLVIVQLARRETNLPFAAFPGRWGKSVTAGCSVYEESFTTDVVFTDNTGAEKSYKVTGTDDDGTTISSTLQPGYVPTDGIESVRVLSLEPFVERSAGFGTLTVKAITSNVLDTTLGTQSTGISVDLAQTPIKETVGVDARGRYLSVRLEWNSSATVRYRGVTLRVPQQSPQA